MSFGERIIELRKKRKISQSELAKKVGIHVNILGRYERGEAKTYTETAAKIADALDVSLDYLVGNSDSQMDQQMVKRLADISALAEEEKEKIFMVVDALVRDVHARKVFA